jgi:hypothetical protein
MWHPARESLTGRQPGNSLYFIAFLSAMFLLWPSSAHAYLDPATGSYVVQILLAMVVSIGVVVKRYYRQLASFSRRLFSGQAQNKPSEEVDSSYTAEKAKGP